MSTPPVQPPNSNEPEPGAQPPAPRYGEIAPQPGPPAPEYGQNAPQYGQNAPQYGQNAPQYGQNPPQAPAYGQQPYGQQYGQSPYAQYPSEQPHATGNNGIPPQVDLAFKLIVAAGILSAVSSLVLAFTGGDYFLQLLDKQLQSQGQQLPAGSVEGMQGVMMVGSIIGAIISLGLYALVAFPVRKGKNWARILGTVFAAISVLGLFGGIFTFGPVYGILQILVILLGVAGIVLLYLPANSPYFQRQQPFANPYGQPGNPYGR